MSRSYRFAVLGRGISYSKSPAVFAAISKLTGIPISFEIRSIEADALETELLHLRAAEFDAFALTTPFKEAIVPFLTALDPTAKRIQSVNSVKCDTGSLTGFNTDIDGFLAGLPPHRPDDRKGQALILGTGGAARAVAYALLHGNRAPGVTMSGRSRANPNMIAGFTTEYVPGDELTRMETSNYGLIVNCTPLGGWNSPNVLPLPPDFRFAPQATYYDLNYNDGNRALRFAADKGCTTVDGSAMLVGQAAKSFFLWSGESVQVEPVYKLVFGRPFRA